MAIRGIDRLIGRIIRRSGGGEPAAVFHCECGIRGKRSFNDYFKVEIERHMQDPICGGERIPWLGFLAGGEFCPTAGRNLFHSYTTTLAALYRWDGDG